MLVNMIILYIYNIVKENFKLFANNGLYFAPSAQDGIVHFDEAHTKSLKRNYTVFQDIAINCEL